MSDTLSEALKQLEAERQIHDNLVYHELRIETLEKGLNNLAKNVAIIANTSASQQGRKPYKCPICEGGGIVAIEWGKGPIPCHACKGEGIVWG